MLEAWVGLRPGRPTVRLEKEVMKFKDELGKEKSLKVSRENNCLLLYNPKNLEIIAHVITIAVMESHGK